MKRKVIFLVFFMIFPLFLFAAMQKNIQTINVLQWWGYLSSDDPYVKKIENECHVKISYDQFYSNDEFIHRINDPNSSYDISIFSYTVFNAVKNKIATNDSQFYKMSKTYNPKIRAQYERYKLPHNVLFFIHSLTGFLYNPENMAISESDGMAGLFRRAKNGLVVMIDDPIEAEFFFNLALRSSGKADGKLNQHVSPKLLTVDNFDKLFKGKNVIITNLPGKIADHNNFAFAFQWSGDAIRILKNNNKNLKFFIHPKLSYVTTDLIATLNNRPSTVCVAERLAGKHFLNHEQNLTYYFSPYADDSEITDPYFKKVFEDWHDKLPSLPWIVSVNNEQFKYLDKAWNNIKMRIMERNIAE